MHGFRPQSERMEQARAMRAGGASWGRIVAATGISVYLLKCELVPGYREKERQKVIDLRAGKRRGVGRRMRMIVASQVSSIPHKVHEAQIIPVSVLNERDQVRAQPLTLNQLIFGDPLPGRSALDKKRQKTEAQRVFG